MEQDTIQKMLKSIKEQKKSLIEHTGIESSTTEGEMREYLNQVMQELSNINKKKSYTDGSNNRLADDV